MKTLQILLFALLVLSISAYAMDFTSSTVMNVDVNGEIEVIPTAASHNVDYVIAKLDFYPRGTDEQSINSLDITPSPDEKTDFIKFKWYSPEEKKLRFRVLSNVEAKNRLKPIKGKIKYPYAYSEQYSKYLQSSDLIDSQDPRIRDLAFRLTEGEDDLSIVANDVASWVRTNINYSLDTSTAEVTQKASWVLVHKYGVCDEITVLFVSMMRSLGVPTRYVSGLAYTNFNSINDWNSHAWAEVYFPEVGWVPYDISYGQLGWVDNTHIKMKESVSPEEASTKYEWFGDNFRLGTRKLDVKVTRINEYGRLPEVVKFTASPLQEAVRPGSYNIIRAFVKNPNDFYSPVELMMSKPDELSIIGREFKDIILKPYEEQEVLWIVKVSDSLSPGFEYDFPVAITSTRNLTVETSFRCNREGAFLEESVVRSIEQGKERETKDIIMQFQCAPEKQQIDSDEDSLLICTVKNLGPGSQKNISICNKAMCRKLDLIRNEEKSVNFLINDTVPGKNMLIVTADNQEFSRISVSEVLVLDSPRIMMTDLEYPKTAVYDGKYQLSFMLQKVSLAIPKDVKVIIRQKTGTPQEWLMDSLETDQNFVIEFLGSDLSDKDNIMAVEISWVDDNGNSYDISEELTIELSKTTVSQKVTMFFRDIGRWFEGILV